MKEMNSNSWKKLLPYVVALVVFVGLALIYCTPLMDGKVLQAGDVNNWKGVAEEAREYLEETGETTFWTNSMFGGMPTYQITGTSGPPHAPMYEAAVFRGEAEIGRGSGRTKKQAEQAAALSALQKLQDK